MKDSFTLDEFILYSENLRTISEKSMVENRRAYCSGDYSAPAPDKRVIQNILNYSKALSVMKTKCAGNLSLLLN